MSGRQPTLAYTPLTPEKPKQASKSGQGYTQIGVTTGGAPAYAYAERYEGALSPGKDIWKLQIVSFSPRTNESPILLEYTREAFYINDVTENCEIIPEDDNGMPLVDVDMAPAFRGYPIPPKAAAFINLGCNVRPVHEYDLCAARRYIIRHNDDHRVRFVVDFPEIEVSRSSQIFIYAPGNR